MQISAKHSLNLHLEWPEIQEKPFGGRWGSLQRSPDSLAGVQEREREREKGRKGKGMGGRGGKG